MDEHSPLNELCLHLALLSLMAVGGGLIMVAPDISHFLVDDRHWITSEQFSSAYAIAQAAPGPNLLFISLVGWLIAGWTGAIATTLAVVIPSTVLTLTLISVNTSRFGQRLPVAVRDSLAPIATGFLLATASLFAQAANTSWHADVLTVLAAAVVLRSKLNPVVLIAVGAVAGMLHLI